MSKREVIRLKTSLPMVEYVQKIGSEVGLSNWQTIDQDRVDIFAVCTGDKQWLHIDPERAEAESPYGTTIAHGFLTLGLLTKLQTDSGAWPSDIIATINYGVDRVRFVSPVRVGDRVRCRSILKHAEQRGEDRWLMSIENVVEIEGVERPALVATSLLIMQTEP